MTKHNLILMMALALAGTVFAGCGDDDDDDTTATVDMNPPGNDMTPPGDDMNPPDEDMNVPDPMPRGMANPPTLGDQIDRAGRPGVTTALVGTFLQTDEDARNTLKDDYNADADAATWVADYSETIHGQLAVLDGLDGTCGNQLAFGADVGGGTTDYDLLAAVLADDRIWVNSASTTCEGAYLGVELQALGAGAGGCGGRMPQEDVIDKTYSTLAAGLDALSPSPAVTDGADADDATPPATFPFLAAPL